mgnify:CR=1 FL=1
MTQEKQMTNPLGTDRISTLVARFAVPSIIATLVSAVYNIADQLFIETQSARSEMLQPISPFHSLCSALRWHCFLGSAEQQALTFIWALDEKRKLLIISATPSLCCSHSDFFYCLSPNCF